MDLFSGKPIGFYGCHHVADSQGFMFEKTHVIRTASRGVPQCLDATGVQDGSAVQLSDCDENAQGMLWVRNGKAESGKLQRKLMVIPPFRNLSLEVALCFMNVMLTCALPMTHPNEGP